MRRACPAGRSIASTRFSPIRKSSISGWANRSSTMRSDRSTWLRPASSSRALHRSCALPLPTAGNKPTRSSTSTATRSTKLVIFARARLSESICIEGEAGMAMSTGLPRGAIYSIVCLLFAAAAAPHGACAQAYPNKPVRIVVPFAPGGGVDVTARILAQRLTERIGQSFIVDNRTGASGMIGTEFVAKSAPDGYTLLVGSQTTHAVVPALYGKVGYDAARDFAPVTEIATSPLLIVVHPSLPVKSVADLIRLAKSRPGQLTFGAASGGTPHMAGEFFKLCACYGKLLFS